MPYTREGILTQVFVALGQGTGAMRISQSACRALAERYAPRIDDALCNEWESSAVQALERLRAIGEGQPGRSVHHTRQTFSGSLTMGWPGLQAKAVANSGMLTTTPLMRASFGE